MGNNMCIDTRFKNANEKFGIEKCAKDGGGGGEQVCTEGRISFKMYTLYL